jgi:hypothetical protein
MAQKVQVLLVDDLDGGEATETVAFSLDGTTYEIDLSSDNATKSLCGGRRPSSPHKDRAGPRAQLGNPGVGQAARLQGQRAWPDSGADHLGVRRSPLGIAPAGPQVPRGGPVFRWTLELRRGTRAGPVLSAHCYPRRPLA